ncbi:alanine racemase [Scopulibacillus cellulosilyticus]|uniref:Alanine racemase n=1 Tax=Scopulibacillus cellulosilyticus TaxID=2665665 RepID=A0ABW2Q1P9_9BACL
MTAPYYRDTWVEVDLDAIESNVKNMRTYLPKNTQLMAVVKANGYGHGAVEVAETALGTGADWLAVAFLDEAIELRLAGIEAPILVLGRVRPEDVPIAARYHISLTVYQTEWLEQAMNFYQKNDPVFLHVKLDTGMGRLGIRDEESLSRFVRKLKEDSRFVLEGAYTHFATADEEDESYFEEQYKRFQTALSWLKSDGVNPNIIHCGNSAASLKHPEKMFNLVRFGISMYGLSPSPSMKHKLPFQLKEAFSLYSRLTHVKKVEPDEAISYGATYRTAGYEWIGTAGIGYADGWHRRLQEQHNQVIVNGERCPVIGRICMDQLMCRLKSEVPAGTKITLIGTDKNECITIDEIAEQLGTINYEIPCMINERVPRIYLKNKEIIKIKNPLIKGMRL